MHHVSRCWDAVGEPGWQGHQSGWAMATMETWKSQSVASTFVKPGVSGNSFYFYVLHSLLLRLSAECIGDALTWIGFIFYPAGVLDSCEDPMNDKVIFPFQAGKKSGLRWYVQASKKNDGHYVTWGDQKNNQTLFQVFVCRCFGWLGLYGVHRFLILQYGSTKKILRRHKKEGFLNQWTPRIFLAQLNKKIVCAAAFSLAVQKSKIEFSRQI